MSRYLQRILQAFWPSTITNEKWLNKILKTPNPQGCRSEDRNSLAMCAECRQTHCPRHSCTKQGTENGANIMMDSSKGRERECNLTWDAITRQDATDSHGASLVEALHAT